MPRRKQDQRSITNPEEKKYQDLYSKVGSNPDSFADIVINEFIRNNIEFSAISQEINAIEKAFGREESLPIIKSFLNTKYVIDDNFSLTLFKTCLDIVCLPSKRIDQGELIQTLMICKSKLYGSVMNDHKNIPQFKEMMIYFLEKTKALADSGLKYEIFDLLKLPGIDDEVKDAIIGSLNLRSRVLTSIIKGDNTDLISKIYIDANELKDTVHEGNGALDYAFAVKNKDAIILLYGFTDIEKYKMPETMGAFPEKADSQHILKFGLEIGKKEGESRKFIHTFKNLSDVGKKQLFSSFLKHKKFPNSGLELENEGLKDFFTTFRQDEEAFQLLADLIKDRPQNQEFITLINSSNLFDQGFKDDLKFKSKTPAERLIDSFKSKDNDDAKKLFLTDILKNKNPESPSPESSTPEDEDLYNFFKIFLRDKENENLFDQFRDENEEFSTLRGTKEGLIGNIYDDIDLEDFITFLNIFSSPDFCETSEEIKVQVEEYVPEFQGDSNLAFHKAFDMPKNHLALSNLYLNYPAETKEIFTHEKLATLLKSDLQVAQKKKLLIKVLEMDFDENEKLGLIKSALESTWEKNKRFFPNQESDEVRELLEKLNAEQISRILLETLFEETNHLNGGYNQNKKEDERYLIRFLFESPRFNYQERSNFLDRSFEEDSNGIMNAIKSDNDGSINIIKNLSINLIQFELADNVFECSPELKAKLLSTALGSENINSEEKIALLKVLLATNDEEKSNLIYDYFSSKDLASTQELLTQEVVGALFTSNLDQEKKLNLAKKILGDDGLDTEFKNSFYYYLPKEFCSRLNRDSEYVESEVESALSGVISKLETQQMANFSAIRVEEKNRSSSPDQPFSQDSLSPIEVDSNRSSPSNLGLSASATTSGFSAIRMGGSDSQSTSPSENFPADSVSNDQRVISAPLSPDGQEISPGSASPVEQEASKSPSITSATIGMGSPEPQTLSAISIVDNVLLFEDFEELQKILKGRVSDGFRDVRSYLLPEELIPDSPLKIFHVDYGDENPSGNAGITRGNKVLKEKFHNNLFDKLVEKIHQSDVKFDEQRLKSYLYAILAISTGESDSITSFFECCDNLIHGGRIKIDGPGHGSWIERPENYVKLKMIVGAMNEIHDESIQNGNPAFTEKNLAQWMKAQVQDRRIEEFKFLNNKEFVDNLIVACDIDPLDAKASELKNVENYLKSFLNANTSFLGKLADISATGDVDNKGLADHLLDYLFAKISSKNSSSDPVAQDTYDQQLQDLRENLIQKTNAFKEKLSSGKLSTLDTEDDHLILDLILEIPIKFDDILKTKIGKSENAFEDRGKIKAFSRDLGDRESIFEFRETCTEQAEIYAKKAKEIQVSPAKFKAR